MHELRAGRTGALAALFERHHARVYRFCLRMTGDRQTAEDLVQDVFMRMLKYSKTFKASSTFDPWMFAITRNACADHWRSTARLDKTTAPTHEDEADEAAQPERIAASAEREDLLHRALMALPLERREVLLLSRFEYKKHEEIADILGCSVGAVRVRIHRAIKQLRDIYIDLAQGALP